VFIFLLLDSTATSASDPLLVRDRRPFLEFWSAEKVLSPLSLASLRGIPSFLFLMLSLFFLAFSGFLVSEFFNGDGFSPYPSVVLGFPFFHPLA